MEPDKPVWCTLEKISLEREKTIHVWIPSSYHGVIIFVRDWENDFNLAYNLHIILVAVGTQLLTVNPITANHVNKHCRNAPPRHPPQFWSFTFY